MTGKVQRGGSGLQRATRGVALCSPLLSISTSVFRQVALQTVAAIGRNALVT
jgi:hypothetical protein